MATGANSAQLSRLNAALAKLKHLNSKAVKREHDDDDSSSSPKPPTTEKKRKRKSRWGDEEEIKTFIPGMPTVLPGNMSKDQEKVYLAQLQIEELSRRIRTGDLGIPQNPEERSPSPEPIYNSDGKRLNTREYYTRKKLEDERHILIMQMYDLNPNYKPPSDYKPPMIKISDKVMIPQDTDINFIGLILGPRGQDLKAMEKETGAKIIIRGKGSVKEGKLARVDGKPLPGEDEPLHAYITANNPESVKKGVEKIKEIIHGDQNTLRRKQLRDLAVLNGTLHENDGLRCSNCGAGTHRSWQCPDKPNLTNNIICTNCGGAGHIAKDCRKKLNEIPGGNGVEKSKIDEEYMSLMAELGEGPKQPTNGMQGMPCTPMMHPMPPRPMMIPQVSYEPPPPGLSPPPAGAAAAPPMHYWQPPYGAVPPPMAMPWMQPVAPPWPTGVPPPPGMPWPQSYMTVPPPPLPGPAPPTTKPEDSNTFNMSAPPPPPPPPSS